MDGCATTTAEEALFLRRWDTLARRLALAPEISEEQGRSLLKLYTGSERHYHSVHHILTMLQDFDQLREEFRQPLAMELAIFYHDSIYDASRSDNEARSAGELHRGLGNHLEADLIEAACFSIEATRTHHSTEDPDTNLLIDLDMAILSKDWPQYLRYARDVMREYVPVYGETAYRRGRVDRFLKPTIETSQVFLTYLYQPLTHQALQNMHRESQLLESGASLGKDSDIYTSDSVE